ncbi:hypothetical protein FHS16_004376 [Paenibacillus endophyticus]|uniref:Uncharacterized protein n=1 Tax=Paenibacillus endophyticus TaxID=1294268 RepID=A0A7W5CCH5_9BACL|nr:hypothetical protein [Paenibacillus endophyticus]MBB3154294.1 hypothetical protein [Paenibacillus endophyticus]
MTDLRPFIARVMTTLAAHRYDAAGRSYGRFLSQLEQDNRNDDVYGTADAAILFYILNEFPHNQDDLNLWIAAIQQHQSEHTGMFAGLGHNELHSTAFALSALELFDGKAKYPLVMLKPLIDKEQIAPFLESLDWRDEPWGESLKGAGLYASLVLSDSVTEDWERTYFDWLRHNADPLTGLWRRDCVKQMDGSLVSAPLFHHIAGSFHYLFNLAHRKEPIPYPGRMVDTCLELYQSGGLEVPTELFSYFHIDWAYTILTCLRQNPIYRREECKAAIRGSSEAFIAGLAKLGEESDEPFDDLHTLCGAVCGLAAIQQITPELIRTDKPLRLVLDRRPFI